MKLEWLDIGQILAVSDDGEEQKVVADVYDVVGEQLVDRFNSHDALVAALEHAIETIKVWHNMGGAAAESVWPIYLANAPEMKRLTAALKAAKGEA